MSAVGGLHEMSNPSFCRRKCFFCELFSAGFRSDVGRLNALAKC